MRVGGEAGIRHRRHRGGAGGGEHVDRGTLDDLGGKPRAATEVEGHLDVRVVGRERVGYRLERFGEGCRGEHGHGAAERALGRGRRLGCGGGAAGECEGRQGGQNKWPPHGTSTTTFVALMLATARLPGSRPSSVAASELMSDTMRNGPA